MKNMQCKTQNGHAGARATSRVRTPFAFFVACFSFFILPLAIVGCGTATVDKPLAQSVGGNDPIQQMEFWHRLAEQPVTSNDDAFHALLLFTDGADPAADYAGRVQALKAKALLPASFDQPANRALDRGTFSVALAKALNVRGGIVMSLFGPTRRYATKELEFASVYPSSSPNQTFSGSEFLAVMSRAEEYQKAQRAGGPTGGAGYVPPEMDLKQGGGTTGPGAPTTAPATRPADAEPAGTAPEPLAPASDRRATQPAL